MIAALANAADTAAVSLFLRLIPTLIPTFQYSRSGCPITLPMEDCEDAEIACATFQERCNAQGESRLPSHFIKKRSEILRVSSAPSRKPEDRQRGAIGAPPAPYFVTALRIEISMRAADMAPSTDMVMRKLPHITALFWTIKMIATTLGETGGDLLAQTLNVGYFFSTVIFFAVLLIAVAVQLRGRRFHPAIFWTAIALTSTAGTTLSDLMNRTGGIGYSGGALVLSTGLVIVFVAWWRSGQTLDVENIATSRGEMLYWIAILVSNSLGTSSGDFLADSLGLGFVPSVAVLSTALLALLALHYCTRVNGMLLFWIAFVLTRPLGANLGNVLTKEHGRGGLGWGTTCTSAALLAALIGLVAYETVQVRRQPLGFLPAPLHRRTGERQRPNGALVSVRSQTTSLE